MFDEKFKTLKTSTSKSVSSIKSLSSESTKKNTVIDDVIIYIIENINARYTECLRNNGGGKKTKRNTRNNKKTRRNTK
jgi:hypothetical protein